jgi:hypothetical protein
VHAAAVAAVTMEVMDRAGDLEVVDLAAEAVDLAAEDLAADSEEADSAVDLEAVEAAGSQRGSKPKRDQRRCCSRSIQPRSVLRHLKLRQRHLRCHQ